MRRLPGAIEPCHPDLKEVVLKKPVQPFAASFLWVVLATAGLPFPALSADIPAEVIDRERSVRKQSEARSEALDQIRDGVAGGQPGIVLDFLGDASGMVRDAVFSRMRKFSAAELDQVVEAWSRHPLRKASPETRDLIEAGLAEVLYHQPRPASADWLLTA